MDETMKVIQEAATGIPADARDHCERAFWLSTSGKHKEAIEEYKQAIRIFPNYAEAHSNLGANYVELGMYGEAIEEYKQAIRIDPDDAKAHYRLGITYFLNNDSGSALEQYEILKTLGSELANTLLEAINNQFGGIESGKTVEFEGVSVVKGNNSLALELYGQLAKKKGNLFFSPYSISTALAMVYAGAREATEAQMAQTLHFKLDQGAIHAGFADLEAQINTAQKRGNVELNVANALWIHQDYPILSDYLDVTTKNYHAGVHNVDFASATEETRREINSWIEDKTNNKIKELIKKGSINSLTRLVLTNAIYFKGQWDSPFVNKWTKEEPFWLSTDKSVDVLLMNQTHEYGYAKNDKLQIIELPYAGNDLSMIVLLPNEVDGLSQLEEDLNVGNLNTWMNPLREIEITVYLPKFKMSSEFKLSEDLSIMGMKDAFDPEMANFSGISPGRLCISKVIHKAFVDVSEEGTEAAASTAVFTGDLMASQNFPQPPVFRADHPFVFIIKHNTSGSILFIGRVINPL